jgi:hypothetical protein
METLASSEVFLFDDFRLHWRSGGLFRRDDNGAFVPSGRRIARARHSWCTDRAGG